MSDEDGKMYLEFKKARKQLIGSDLYVNVDDLYSELKEAVQVFDSRTLTAMSMGYVLLAADIFRYSDAILQIAEALNRYANKGKFDEIVREEEV